MKDIQLNLDIDGFYGTRLPNREQILAAVLSPDAGAAREYAESYADSLFLGEISRFQRKLAEAEEMVATFQEKLALVEQERDQAPSFLHRADETATKGKRQPFWQRVYNGLKCSVAAIAPVMGGSYLVTAMMDQSYTFAASPHLAVLAAAPIGMASFALSSWAIFPTDLRQAERRSNRLLVLSSFAFLLWAGLIAMRFGVSNEGLDLGGGFDPTAAPSSLSPAAQSALDWLELNGISVGALFSHLIADALLSAACVSSAICSNRKVLPVSSDQTDHDLKLEDRADAHQKTIERSREQAAEYQQQLGQYQAARRTVRDMVEQMIMSERERLKAKENAARDEIRAELV